MEKYILYTFSLSMTLDRLLKKPALQLLLEELEFAKIDVPAIWLHRSPTEFSATSSKLSRHIIAIFAALGCKIRHPSGVHLV